uniref:Uncharacterized protein n=1 Tax=Candidatus Kentrum sp. SD TaxID=2126332 RepID=A0A451BIP9_9GAMM|nr:MAG: hypothetical protein BECKSD772D_GA0070982_10086 [Candidatus Kentron sp. SD]
MKRHPRRNGFRRDRDEPPRGRWCFFHGVHLAAGDVGGSWGISLMSRKNKDSGKTGVRARNTPFGDYCYALTNKEHSRTRSVRIYVQLGSIGASPRAALPTARPSRSRIPRGRGRANRSREIFQALKNLISSAVFTASNAVNIHLSSFSSPPSRCSIFHRSLLVASSASPVASLNASEMASACCSGSRNCSVDERI